MGRARPDYESHEVGLDRNELGSLLVAACPRPVWRLRACKLTAGEPARAAGPAAGVVFGRPDLGRVAEGCIADLLILDASISGDPSVVWSPDSRRTIVQNGRVIAGSAAPR